MPTGTKIDVLKTHAKADRLFRAQGNKSGRIRMRQDASLRYAKPPRGLILSTGEDTPKGHSLNARLWNCDISPGDVKQDLLTLCQKDAANGLYVGATVGFIQWFAPRYEEVQRNLQKELRELREMASKDGMHRRTPEIVANLAIGLRVFLAFAEDNGAITAEQSTELWNRGWNALIGGAATQQEQQSVDEPTQQYLELLRAALDSGKAYIADRDGCEPDNSRAWGWVNVFNGDSKPQGNCVGWVDGDDLYLQPKASYAAAQTMGAATGGSLLVTETTLWKRLKGKNILRSMDDGRLTVRKMLAGSRKTVLHLRADVVAQVVAQSVARKSGVFGESVPSQMAANK